MIMIIPPVYNNNTNNNNNTKLWHGILSTFNQCCTHLPKALSSLGTCVQLLP